jgi:hypothetical protein
MNSHSARQGEESGICEQQCRQLRKSRKEMYNEDAKKGRVIHTHINPKPGGYII